jgi:hypothetical protein
MENRHVASEKHAASVIICLFNLALPSLVSLARGTGQTVELPPNGKWQIHPRHFIEILVLLYVGTQWMMTSVDDGNSDPTLQRETGIWPLESTMRTMRVYTILPSYLRS